MRPDEHKQKRSAKYKKKHGIAGKNEGAKKGENSTECVKPRQGLREDEASVSAVKKEEDSKTFSRRKVLSNWDRYDDISDHSSDDGEDRNVTSVKKRGEDFTTLVEKAANPESQFRFQAEQEWEDTREVAIQPATSALEINFGALATCLQSLPLHERLGIQDDSIHSDILGQFQRDAGISSNLEPANTQQMSSDKNTAVSEDKNIEKPREISLQKYSQSSANDRGASLTVSDTPVTCMSGTDKELDTSSAHRSFGLHTSLKDILKTANVVEETDSEHKQAYHKTKVLDSFKVEQEEDELDFLLALDTPSEQRQSQHHSPELKQVASNITNQKSLLLQTDKGKTSQVDDDLEDWLDSVLG